MRAPPFEVPDDTVDRRQPIVKHDAAALQRTRAGRITVFLHSSGGPFCRGFSWEMSLLRLASGFIGETTESQVDIPKPSNHRGTADKPLRQSVDQSGLAVIYFNGTLATEGILAVSISSVS